MGASRTTRMAAAVALAAVVVAAVLVAFTSLRIEALGAVMVLGVGAAATAVLLLAPAGSSGPPS